MTTGQSKADSKEAPGEFGEYDTGPDERGTAKPQQGQGTTHGGLSERVKELAKPKEPKIAEHTCVGPHVMWGTQDSLWPVSPRAMAGSATSRVQALAAPKKDFQKGTVHDGRPLYYYSAGRSSVIWSVSEGTRKGTATERVQFLAKHKKTHPDYIDDKDQYFYSCGRETPIWKVPQGAKQSTERQRSMLLASYKDYHPEFQGERPVQTEISVAALMATATDRVAGLAGPKKHAEEQIRDPVWPVSHGALRTVASTRCTELAMTKPLAEGYRQPRGVEWPVSKAAKKAQASPRLEELSRPITRDTMDTVQFNPQAFSVKQSALTGVIPSRIQELAQPINR